MSDILEIVRRNAISVQRGCDGRDLHPMSAMRAGEKQTRQVRWGNVLVMHGALLVARPPNYAALTPRPIYEKVNDYLCDAQCLCIRTFCRVYLRLWKGPAPTNSVWGDGRSRNGDVPFGLGHHSSVNGRVAGPALRAVDKEAMHLIVLGVQQDRPAVAA
jgi:hypothetical protein